MILLIFFACVFLVYPALWPFLLIGGLLIFVSIVRTAIVAASNLCSLCGNTVADTSSLCPACGARLSSPPVKWGLTIFLLTVLSVLAIGFVTADQWKPRLPEFISWAKRYLRISE